jgi:hypothetical protein
VLVVGAHLLGLDGAHQLIPDLKHPRNLKPCFYYIKFNLKCWSDRRNTHEWCTCDATSLLVIDQFQSSISIQSIL